MPITVKFSNPVRDWIAHNLDRGADGRDIVRELMSNGTQPDLANAMVNAVIHALRHRGPLPDGKLVLETETSPAAGRPRREASTMETEDRRVRVLARLSRPAATLLSNVLGDEECEQLISAARPRLRPSLVVDPITGLDVAKDHRSSWGMFFRPGENAVIQAIERRIARLIDRPVDHGEGLQILHYPTGAESTPHFDFLMPVNEANRASIARSGQRVCTFIMYLNDVPAGGETTFPEVGWSVVPRRGHALHFEYGTGVRPGDPAAGDPASLHAGAPVLQGEKWIATKWVRDRVFVPRGA
ncbi:proline dioxygenase [Bordetella genomosp. 8]|uniref:Proline dioxygenase n=1 Tax=Bordetella genomosp. 8 TaxID=1416806 RepID=A0A1W6YNS6_9BORD|nr:2OG-Fe(II) oxygenase [Bordetella genomosp. 8]ARP82671.1 proline dioxygenase [Bordetella genomosp. 8]